MVAEPAISALGQQQAESAEALHARVHANAQPISSSQKRCLRGRAGHALACGSWRIGYDAQQLLHQAGQFGHQQICHANQVQYQGSAFQPYPQPLPSKSLLD
jgi:hypothetical protein